MEFAIVNIYMGPIATKSMKGFSDEDLRATMDDYRVKESFIYTWCIGFILGTQDI